MKQRIRVLLVLPMYGGSLPVGRFCQRALNKLGCLVDVFEAPSFYSAFTALKDLRVAVERLEYLENSFLQVISQAVLAKVQSFEPDLVLSMAQAPLSRQALRKLRQDGVPTAMWFVEDFRLFTYWRAFAPLYDFFAVIQKEPFLDELAKLGVPHPFYLPLAADPDFHRPMELDPAARRRFGSELSFVGAGYPNRRTAFRRLMTHDFKIWGNDWDNENILAPHLQMGGARVSSEDAVKIFNASAINLNLHSSVQPGADVAPGDFVNPRTFELAACGAFQLVDRRALLSELFAENELATFSNMDELLAGVERYLARPDERQALAERARSRVLTEHTYEHRMRALLDQVAAALPDWPRERSAGPDMEGVPPELQAEIAQLLQGLDLPTDASFPDLAQAVRQRQGRLSELETAVLFLDEWRKQYVRKT